MNDYENKYFKEGFNLIAGIDEAGRGALCGQLLLLFACFQKTI